MHYSLQYLAVLLVFLSSCTSEVSVIPQEGIFTEITTNTYEDNCKWIYAQMNRNYLWREDMPDSTACDYTIDPVSFYENLLSPKDRFSYYKYNDSYSPPSGRASYGFAYQPYIDKDGLEYWLVLYVKSATLRKAGLRRGDWLRAPTTDCPLGSFVKMRIVAGKLEPTDTLIVATKALGEEENTVLLDSIYTVEGKRIGYLCYLEYGDKYDLVAPLAHFYNSSIDALVLDLRYNPGGYVSTSKYLCNCIVPTEGYEQLFNIQSYNNVISAERYSKTGDSLDYEYFTTPPSDLQLNSVIGLNLKKLYVLTSRHTASASEATIVCLRPYMEVILIGEKTTGKGVGSWPISDQKYKYALQPITFRYYNAQMISTPDEGLSVDYEVPDGYATARKEIGNSSEPLLAAALGLITHNEIPSSVTALFSSRDNELVGLHAIGNPSFVNDFKRKNYE